MTNKRTLITAGTIITMDQDYRILEPGYLIVQDDVIVTIESGTPPETGFDEKVDLSNHLLMPGLINCHTLILLWYSPEECVRE